MKLSEKISFLRKERGWSQEQLALRLDISRQAVYKWEADISSPEIDKLKKLSKLFEISCDILMDDDIDLPIDNEISTDAAVPSAITDACSSDANQETSADNTIDIAESSTQKPRGSKLTLIIIILSSLILLGAVITGVIFLVDTPNKPDSLTVTFDSNGGSAISSQHIENDNLVKKVLPPVRSGYIFDGWYYNGVEWDFDNDTVTKNITLVAKWIPKLNTITLNSNNEANETKELYIYTDQAALLDSAFFKTGYFLVGWATSPNGTAIYSNNAKYVADSGDTVLYAVWSPIEYTIKYNLDGGMFIDPAPTIFTIENEIILPKPIKEGHSFLFWATKNGAAIDKIEKGTTKDIEIFATFLEGPYAINYHLDGGENNIKNPSTYLSSQLITLLPPTKPRNRFEGWYLDKEFTRPVETMVPEKGDIDLYAKWTYTGFIYTLNENGNYTLESYLGTDKAINVPSEYEGVTVDQIGNGAFTGSSYTTSINLPDTITKIGENAFFGCSSLNVIELPYGITVIPKGAFNGCASLKSIILPESLAKIESEAFFGCGLEEINIPKSVSSISLDAFNYCLAIKNYTVSSENPTYSAIDGNLYINEGSRLIKYAVGKNQTAFTGPLGLKFVDRYAFLGCSKLNVVVFMDGLGGIEANAFESCNYLKSIQLGNRIDYIGAKAFLNCTSLESITFSHSLYSVGNYAFSGCVALKSVVFEDSVGEIGYMAFSKCSSLESVQFKSTLDKLSSKCFESCRALKEINLPLGITEIGDSTFIHCLALSSFTIPSSVTKIGKQAFAYTSITDIFIPKSVEIMERNVFEGCYDITVKCQADIIPEAWDEYWSTSIKEYILGVQP